jgi:hypothetical protein
MQSQLEAAPHILHHAFAFQCLIQTVNLYPWSVSANPYDDKNLLDVVVEDTGSFSVSDCATVHRSFGVGQRVSFGFALVD